jgi:nucleotide-binding universal stress UspA family protein
MALAREDTMTAKLLVALDGRLGSEKALEVAVEQAQMKGGQLTALAVLNRSGDPHLEPSAEAVRVRARQQLEGILQAAVNFARSRGVTLRPVLREGHPAETIVACAEQEGVELVVLGSHNGAATRPGLGGTSDPGAGHGTVECCWACKRCFCVRSDVVRAFGRERAL